MKTLFSQHIHRFATVIFLTAILASGCSISGLKNQILEANKFLASGNDLYKEGRYQEACVQFSKSIERAESVRLKCMLTPDCGLPNGFIYDLSSVYDNRALAYMGNNQIELALQDSRKSIYYMENNPIANSHMILIWALILRGDKAAAQEEIQVLKKLDEDLANECNDYVSSWDGAYQIRKIFLMKTSYAKGVEAYDAKDYERALAIWQPLAEQGLMEAQHNVGVMCEKGLGVSPNDQTALLWFQKAADQGYAYSQWVVGLAYNEGIGVPVNQELAYMWVSLASATGFPKASKDLEDMEKDMLPTQIKKAKALAHEWNEKHKMRNK